MENQETTHARLSTLTKERLEDLKLEKSQSISDVIDLLLNGKLEDLKEAKKLMDQTRSKVGALLQIEPSEGNVYKESQKAKKQGTLEKDTSLKLSMTEAFILQDQTLTYSYSQQGRAVSVEYDLSLYPSCQSQLEKAMRHQPSMEMI